MFHSFLKFILLYSLFELYICIYIYKYILFYFHVCVFAVHPENCSACSASRKVSGPGEVSFWEVFFTHHAQLS